MGLYYYMLSSFGFVSLVVAMLISMWDTNEEILDVTIHSTKNAYKYNGLPAKVDASLVKLVKCELSQINVLYRHGSRSPSKKDLRKAMDLFERFNQSQSQLIPKEILNYKERAISLDDEKQLSHSGREELYNLGLRMADKYAGRIVGLQRVFTDSNTIFRTSSMERSIESGSHFIRGLMYPNKNDAADNEKLLVRRDDLVRFFDNCPKFNSIEGDAKTEMKKFAAGPQMQQVIKEVTAKFNLTDVTLTYSDIKVIFSMCGMDLANNISESLLQSGWCRFLTDRQKLVVEYMLELKKYYQYAYGFEINFLQSCPLIAQMIEDMELAIQSNIHDSKIPRGVFSFGHAETVIPVLARLGLFNQTEKPTADNFDRISRLDDLSRFRISRLAPFAANVGLALYRCQDSTNSSQTEYRVQPLVNEQPVHWDLCASTHCSWEQFINHFSSCSPKSFDFAKTCAK